MKIELTLFVCSLFGGYFVTADDIQEEIYYGSNAVRNQFPYIARTLIGNADSYRTNSYAACGGSLINPQWVVSAAHCAVGGKFALIYLGMLNTNDATGTIRDNTSRIFIHPNYNPSANANDIVLYRLTKPVNLTAYANIKAIPITNKAANSVTQYDGKYLTASGWGKTQSGSGATTLQFVTIKVLNSSTCIQRFKPGASTTTICTERITKNAGPCNGDSGGPLAGNSTAGTPELVGLTSFGVGTGDICADRNGAVVYTYLPSFVSWIQQTIAANP